jgi:hypothetical protein
MSAGHSLRRQNYSFVSITPPTVAHPETAWHFTRVTVVVISAFVLDLASFATLSMLIAGR